MPVALALLSSKNSRLLANTLSWSPFVSLSSDFNPLVDFIAREQFRDFRPDVIISMQKRALIRRIGLFLCRGWAQHIVDRWRDAVSPLSWFFALCLKRF